MYLQVYNSRGNEYVRILESFRDPVTKKPKQRVIQNYGSKEALLARNPLALQKIEEKVKHRNLKGEKQREETLTVVPMANGQQMYLRNAKRELVDPIYQALGMKPVASCGHVKEI